MTVSYCQLRTLRTLWSFTFVAFSVRVRRCLVKDFIATVAWVACAVLSARCRIMLCIFFPGFSYFSKVIIQSRMNSNPMKPHLQGSLSYYYPDLVSCVNLNPNLDPNHNFTSTRNPSSFYFLSPLTDDLVRNIHCRIICSECTDV